MTKLTRVLSTGVIAGLVITGQVAQLTTVSAEDFTENIQQTWEKEEVNSSKKENIPTGVESYFLAYVGLALVSGVGVYKLTKE